MKINVKIDSNLRKASSLEPPKALYLSDKQNTLEDVLKKLSGMYADLLLIKNGKTSDELNQLLLNGESLEKIPEGLKKNVSEGDTIIIDIFIDGLAGG